MAEKKVPPKPEGQKKKEERDAKLAAALKKQRDDRRASNKTKRAEILKRAQTYEAEYAKKNAQEVNARRLAKQTGQIYVPSASRVAFVMRIRGINQMNPKVVRILRLLRLRQIHNATFVRVNKASVNLIRRVEPYVTFGYNIS